MSIFKACDIRGKYGEDITEPIMRNIGRAMATLLLRAHHGDLEKPSILVSGDCRTSTPALKEALIQGVLTTGVDVLDIGVDIPTPVARYAFRKLLPDALAIVTASHNPPGYNGLKLQLSDRPITPEEIQRIQEIAEAEEESVHRSSADTPGVVREIDMIGPYEQWILETFAQGAAVKVVVDPGNGCYSDLAPELMSRLGFDVVKLFCRIDGRFPNRSPNSAIADNLTALCEEVQRTGAALGVAFDGDGDRVAFVDEKGRSVPYDKAVVIMAKDILTHEMVGRSPEEKKVIYEINCSQAVPDELARIGATPLIERAGHAFITTRMIDEKAVFGGEVSGHFFYGELGGSDDGLYSAIRMGRLLASANEPLSEIVDGVPEYSATPVLRLPFDAREGHEAVQAIIACAGKEAEVIDIDGVRVHYPEGWGLVRVSITEPVISIRFETYRSEDLPTLVEECLRPVPHLLAEVRRSLSMT